MENVSVLVAIGVGDDGRREVIGIAEGMKEDAASWESFIRSMIGRGLSGVRLVVGNRNPGLVRAVGELLPGARYQRCVVHFECNVLAKVPRRKRKPVAAKLKAVFAMEDREKTLAKAESVAAELDSVKLREAASCLHEGIGEATVYQLPEFPAEHWRLIRTNNMIECPDREIRRRTRVVGQFPDGRSALMPVIVRVRHVTQNWPERRYLDMSPLEPIMENTVGTPHEGDQS